MDDLIEKAKYLKNQGYSALIAGSQVYQGLTPKLTAYVLKRAGYTWDEVFDAFPFALGQVLWDIRAGIELAQEQEKEESE